MEVSNSQTFISNPNASLGVARGVANVAGVSPNMVTVTMSASRRLHSHLPRLLQVSGTVDVEYIITVPASAPAAGAGSATNIQSALATTDATALTTAVSNGVASTSSGTFTVIVHKVRAPTSKTPGIAPAPEPAPKPAPPPPSKGKGPPVGAIVGGVVGGIAVLGLIGGGAYYGKRRMAIRRSSRSNEGNERGNPEDSPWCEDNPQFNLAEFEQNANEAAINPQVHDVPRMRRQSTPLFPQSETPQAPSHDGASDVTF